MLIPLSILIDKHKLKITGVVHIGAHRCEELTDYLHHNIPMDRILWFEALQELVREYQSKGIKIFQAVLSSVDDVKCDFIVTDNYMSSSLLELKEHLIEHPHVHEIRRDQVSTVTFNTLVEREKIDLTDLNFLKLVC